MSYLHSRQTIESMPPEDAEFACLPASIDALLQGVDVDPADYKRVIEDARRSAELASSAGHVTLSGIPEVYGYLASRYFSGRWIMEHHPVGQFEFNVGLDPFVDETRLDIRANHLHFRDDLAMVDRTLAEGSSDPAALEDYRRYIASQVGLAIGLDNSFEEGFTVLGLQERGEDLHTFGIQPTDSSMYTVYDIRLTGSEQRRTVLELGPLSLRNLVGLYDPEQPDVAAEAEELFSPVSLDSGPAMSFLAFPAQF